MVSELRGDQLHQTTHARKSADRRSWRIALRVIPWR